jgi:hypothetical protein
MNNCWPSSSTKATWHRNLPIERLLQPPGLLLGCGCVPEAQIQPGFDLLAQAIDEALP